MSDATVLIGDCLESLRAMPDRSVHCCVTSPPYFGLRDYGMDGQIGLEDTPDAFVSRLVEVFREVRRVLRDDGTLWLNLGDSYAGTGVSGAMGKPNLSRHGDASINPKNASLKYGRSPTPEGLKQKNLLGIPWRVAFALQDDGWYLRQDIIWHKPNPMPESVKDRCTKAHEYLFMLSKGPRYYYDVDAIKEPALQPRGNPKQVAQHKQAVLGANRNGTHGTNHGAETRNRRSVWTVSTKPYAGAHFATFPPDLIEPCILAGCPIGGSVLDPFGGSGTTAGVAIKHGRNAILCELNPEYAALIPARIASIAGDTPDMFMEAAE